MDLWFTEYQTPSLGITLKAAKTLYAGKSEYQEIAVIETEQYGRMLVLDGTVQTTVNDEFIYHEMIVHVPLNTHKNAENILIVGGGDGGAVREALRYPSVKRVVLAEIDPAVIEVSRRFFPEISCGLDDRRVEIIVGDGIKYVEGNPDMFDVVIVDSTDPVGPATGLFANSFHKSISRCLKHDGIYVAQNESPFLHTELIKKVHGSVRAVFPIAKLFTSPVPTYPGGYWCFIIGSKVYDPLSCEYKAGKINETRYYNPEIHKASFALPSFLKKELE